MFLFFKKNALQSIALSSLLVFLFIKKGFGRGKA